MRSLVGILVVVAPAVALAQQPQNPYGTSPPPTTAAPGQQQYPYYPPPQQQYPYYPPPAPRPAAPVAPPAPARLTLATRSMDVAQLVTACANALDNYHL